MKTGKYGEPWKVSDAGIVVCADISMTQPESDQKRKERNIRACACVNALAGRDPAALEGLVAACREAIEQAQYVDDAIGDSTFGERLSAALAAFQGGGE